MVNQSLRTYPETLWNPGHSVGELRYSDRLLIRVSFWSLAMFGPNDPLVAANQRVKNDTATACQGSSMPGRGSNEAPKRKWKHSGGRLLRPVAQ